MNSHEHLRPPTASAESAGWDVLEAALHEANARFGTQLVAAYALGSLAHGGFTPLVSDVDLALMFAELPADAASQMEAIKAQVILQVQTALAWRLSLFWATWDDLAAQQTAGRFPLIDRLDLLQHGRCIWGKDERALLRLPAANDLRDALLTETIAFFLAQSATPTAEYLHDIASLSVAGTQKITKTVLFPVRALLAAETGTTAGNVEAVNHYLATRQGANRCALVQAAAAWRITGFDVSNAASGELLERYLHSLYAEFATICSTHLRHSGQDGLAKQLDTWRQQAIPQ